MILSKPKEPKKELEEKNHVIAEINAKLKKDVDGAKIVVGGIRRKDLRQ